jgi:DNA replication protein DnaC
MTRQQLLDLIKYSLKDNKQMIISTTKKISRDVRLSGDSELSRKINKLIRQNLKIVLSDKTNSDFYMTKYQKEILNVITQGVYAHMMNKFFIYGRPGTGKTTFVKELANTINKKYVILNLSSIIDSKLGESIKNMEKLFENKKDLLIFLDEVDSVASSRKTTHDIQEMFRVLNILLHFF